MEQKPTLLEKAAALRDKATRARRLAVGLQHADQARLEGFAEELRNQATQLERQAAGESPSRPPEPRSDRADNQNDHKQKKQSGGSNDPDPQV